MPAIPQPSDMRTAHWSSPAPGISSLGLMARGQSSPISTFSSYGSNCYRGEMAPLHSCLRSWDQAPVHGNCSRQRNTGAFTDIIYRQSMHHFTVDCFSANIVASFILTGCPVAFSLSMVCWAMKVELDWSSNSAYTMMDSSGASL